MQVIDVTLDGSGRFHRQAGARAGRPDGIGGTGQVGDGLSVDRDVGRAPLGIAGGPAVRIGDHQMAVKRGCGDRAQRGHGIRRQRQVGDEVVVHDVDVQPVGVPLDRQGRLRDPPEVGGEQARVDLRGGHACERIGRLWAARLR